LMKQVVWFCRRFTSHAYAAGKFPVSAIPLAQKEVEARLMQPHLFVYVQEEGALSTIPFAHEAGGLVLQTIHFARICCRKVSCEHYPVGSERG
ncbi:hypothetical protein, partial [Paenibacillus aestuarii]|uniref:hypothetical protein n=1 Tax=Paenibacillus aestuarii TaxID=516965 RepID=UPI0022E9EF04